MAEEPSRSDRCSTAVVLAGGGALGAYETGVLRYVLDTLRLDGECAPRFDVFAGTSIGALNACFLASRADDPAASGRRLADYWRSIEFADVLRFGNRELKNVGRVLFGPTRRSSRMWLRRSQQSPATHPPVAGIFDNSRLHERMRTAIPWARLQHNLREGRVRGVALCATEVCTGMSTIFFQTAPGVDYQCGTDPSKAAVPVVVGVEHAMASAAIPFLFPAVMVNGVCYTDGGLRQNTPLNPAMRLMADHVLVVSVTQPIAVSARTARIGCRRNPYPGPLFLAGKLLPALLAESLEYELHRIERYNHLIRRGGEEYGEDFVDKLNDILGAGRNATFRKVTTFHLHPSVDPTVLARKALEAAPDEIDVPGAGGRLVERLMKSPSLAESELLSVLMFTPTYIRALLDLGYRDAEAQRERLVEFFGQGR